MHCPQCRYLLVRQRADHTVFLTRMIEIRKSDGQVTLTCPRCRTETALSPEVSTLIRSMVLVAVPTPTLVEAR